jgi:hypothetical protein
MHENRSIVFFSQAGSLRLFADLAACLHHDGVLVRAGFYVTGSRYFSDFVGERSGFETSADIVKEWEILERAKQTPPDPARVAELEQRYGESLWNAIVADRRLGMGRNAVREQDYKPRYSRDELLSILIAAADALEALFDRLRPDFVVTFICVTVGEYLAQLIARARSIPLINLRPTRIRNFFYGGEDVFEPSARLNAVYRDFLINGIPEAARATARDILAAVRASHAMYEGVLPAASQAIAPANPDSGAAAAATRETAMARIARIAREIWAYNFGVLRADNHHAGRFAAHWFHHVKKPYRVRSMRVALEGQYVRDLEVLGRDGYAFFPLHKEPEVTLLVYGRPWRNQIEAVRNIARALPAGMTLLVKEHPASIGYRPLSYYRKLLAIPGVKLVAPERTSRDVLNHARLVTIIGGSVGLEALMLKLPVIALGNVPFSFLPGSMIRTSRDPDRIGEDVAALLSCHRHDEAALETYVAAVVESSVPVDFYSVLLRRGGGIYRPGGPDTTPYNVQLNRLAKYVMQCYRLFTAQNGHTESRVAAQ